MEALDIPNTNEPAIHFSFNERNQNRKLAKISKHAHAHRQTANLGFPSAWAPSRILFLLASHALTCMVQH
jgi:hypothetical protein